VKGEQVNVREAAPGDLITVSGILTEAASWLRDRGMSLWDVQEVSVDRLRAEAGAGLFVLAECNGRAVGTLQYLLEDPLTWPDAREGESAFVHRLAVRRGHTGGVISGALLEWAVGRTRALGRRYLRLDCEASRDKLRRFYERFGFRYHSDRRVGPYHVARYQYPVC